MSLHGRGIDQHLLRWSVGQCQGMEDIRPDTLGRPAHEAIVERLARAIDGWRIDPTAAGLQDMDDPADDAAVIDPWLAARVGRKMRLKSCKLSRTQPEIGPIHQRSPFGDFESRNGRCGNLFYGSRT